MNQEQTPPDEIPAMLQAGIAASQAGQADEAIRCFRAVAALAPGWGLPLFLLGSEHAAAGRFEEAEGCLARAVLLEPQLKLARYQLGLLQFSGGRAATALLTWQPLRGAPDETGLADFVEGFAALAVDDFPAARAHFERGTAQPQVNEAVARDVQRVLERMDAQMEAQQPRPAPAEPAAEATHVLLSNYARGLH